MRIRHKLAALAAAALMAVVGLTPAAAATDAHLGVLSETFAPAGASAASTAMVELGMKFTPTTNGTLKGVQFYQNAADAGVTSVSVWSASGSRLTQKSISSTGSVGWRTIPVSVALGAGKSYTVSVFDSNGRYPSVQPYFTAARSVNGIRVPADAGVYKYGTASGFPSQSWKSANYFVDVAFEPAPAPTATPAPTSTPAPPATSTPVELAIAGDLDLPRIPWEGGPAYYKQFPKADEAGWDDPSFLPVMIWYDAWSDDAEVKWDKSLGINTYGGAVWEGTPIQPLIDNDMYWVGASMSPEWEKLGKNWPGNLLDDEVDGRFAPEDGFAHLQRISDVYEGDGRFNYANYTQGVVSEDMAPADAQRYVNDFTDVVSLDMYWYTIDFCDWANYRGDVYLKDIAQSNCRTSSSYGKMMQSLRQQDAVDGKLQPIWGFVENYNGGSSTIPAETISPDQMKGGVMNSIINEARGIHYFNQSFNGNCLAGNIVRQAQVVGPSYCAYEQVMAMKDVNTKIHALATVINTQSYDYSFGPGLDTMLKTKDGSAYIFAMVDGNSQPGSRSFQLPAGVTGRTVTVLNEDRTLTADSTGKFVDTFPAEYSYHIYKVSQ